VIDQSVQAGETVSPDKAIVLTYGDVPGTSR
jgi:beta-lactam-binding protein with PASTA domain